MSAPALHLHAFSAPIVNGRVVSVLCTLGTSAAVIEGNLGLFCDFARDVLVACGQLAHKPAPLPGGERKTGRQVSPRLAARKALYREVLAISRAPHVHGAIAQALRERGLNSESYYAWATQQQRRESA